MQKNLKVLIPIFISTFIIFLDYKSSYLNSLKQTINILISPVYLVANLPSQLYIWINEQNTTKQILLSQNKKLKAELLRLKVDLQVHNALLLENKKLGQLLKSRYKLDKKEFILARVISVSQSRLKKQISINKGSGDGIKIGQVVLGADGVLGQVSHVTSLYSSVLLITDPSQHIPVKNERNGVRGIGKGMAFYKEKLMVNFIQHGLDINIGDIFLSSAIGSKFPEGYPVGRVTHIDKKKNDQFLTIELTPSQTIEQLEFVLINNISKTF